MIVVEHGDNDPIEAADRRHQPIIREALPSRRDGLFEGLIECWCVGVKVGRELRNCLADVELAGDDVGYEARAELAKEMNVTRRFASS